MIPKAASETAIVIGRDALRSQALTTIAIEARMRTAAGSDVKT
jgi:hypothetical protein